MKIHEAIRRDIHEMKLRHVTPDEVWVNHHTFLELNNRHTLDIEFRDGQFMFDGVRIQVRRNPPFDFRVMGYLMP